MYASSVVIWHHWVEGFVSRVKEDGSNDRNNDRGEPYSLMIFDSGLIWREMDAARTTYPRMRLNEYPSSFNKYIEG